MFKADSPNDGSEEQAMRKYQIISRNPGIGTKKVKEPNTN